MEQNQRNNDWTENNNAQTGQQNNQDSDSLNTSSGLREQAQRQEDESGSGRSYDYGSENSTEDDMNQQLGRNSNQQNVSNPISTPGAGSDNLPGSGRSDSRAGMGSGQTTKQSITGSDFDGQNRTS